MRSASSTQCCAIEVSTAFTSARIANFAACRQAAACSRYSCAAVILPKRHYVVRPTTVPPEGGTAARLDFSRRACPGRPWPGRGEVGGLAGGGRGRVRRRGGRCRDRAARRRGGREPCSRRPPPEACAVRWDRAGARPPAGSFWPFAGNFHARARTPRFFRVGFYTQNAFTAVIVPQPCGGFS